MQVDEGQGSRDISEAETGVRHRDRACTCTVERQRKGGIVSRIGIS